MCRWLAYSGTPVLLEELLYGIRLTAVPFVARFLLPVTNLVPRLGLRPGLAKRETQRHFG